MGKKLVIAVSAISIAVIIASAVIIFLKLSDNNKKTVEVNIENEVSRGGETEENKDSQTAEVIESVNSEFEVRLGERPRFLEQYGALYDKSLIPSVPGYNVAYDFSNVDNIKLYQYLDEEIKDKLRENYFCVAGGYGNEFFEVYEGNRYDYQSNFITVDSLMHTYHLFFSHLLKNTEKNYLAVKLSEISYFMVNESILQYEKLKGTEWEDAAKRNIEFFSVGMKLLDKDFMPAEDFARDIVNSEYDKIMSASDMTESSIMPDKFEDYTQYRPRGYYEGDIALENYFRAMMWYGRMQFDAKDEEMTKSACLIAKAMNDSCLENWDAVYEVTAFFAGASDDLGYYEYYPVMQAAYGENVDLDRMAEDKAAFNALLDSIKTLKVPSINSTPIMAGDDNIIKGFRFMGQRFTIDAMIMQNLIYSSVGPNSSDNLRMLPDVLDVTAALGSDISDRILERQGDMDYSGYAEKLNMLKSQLDEGNEETRQMFNASLYANWLNTLRPILEKKGEGYPAFMRSEEWQKKDIECFAGSFTELKHDTVLYSKQVMAEMGDGEIDVYDDRGYVQPEPEVYSRFAYLSKETKNGLQKFGMISDNDAENLDKLYNLANMLMEMSVKELQNETLSDREYEEIKEYGGYLEHFWHEAVAEGEDRYIGTEEYPAALVVDVATDPDSGTVLEMGTGDPSIIYVLVEVAGKLKIARGSVYSFYQFNWPANDRLTDSKWRRMMGFVWDEEGRDYLEPAERPVQPEWTDSYRYRYYY